MNGQIEKAAEILKNGGVVILPTDTVFGLFTRISNEAGIERIYRMKERDKDKPLVILIPDIEDVWNWVEKSESLEELCRRYWPGATTLIMRTKDKGTIGIRNPDCPPVIEVMKITGPLYATSANVSGTKAPASIEEIPSSIKENCDLVEDFSCHPSGEPSQIIDVSTDDIKVIRS
ncbi:L-threonylcarbamoyladenylate synthase [Elusimicrobiota bacterium]